MSKARVIICDDEMLIRLWLSEHIADAGYLTEAVENGEELMAACAREAPDVVLLDLRLPGESGLELLPRLRAMDPTLPVIMMTAYGEVETAVGAVRSGAFHFLEKPIALPEILLLLEQALETRRLRTEVERYREGYRWQFADVALVGRSPALKRVAELITRVGIKSSAVNILIRGESGTGKDVVARAIHARGPRRAHPFIHVNCTAIPEHLVESELFGHEKGAYTDARESKKGLFDLAHRGTLFLDEIGDMPRALQAKLLQVLETHRFRRVGGVKEMDVDVHVIAATNRNLEQAVADGHFRGDLFYRLNVLPILLPPLRERPDDILPLATHFVTTLCRDLSQPSRELSADTICALEHYDWPGNARELRNVLERILLVEEDDQVRLHHLPPAIAAVLESATMTVNTGSRVHPTPPSSARWNLHDITHMNTPAHTRAHTSSSATAPRARPMVLPAEGIDLDGAERELIAQALHRVAGNKTAAARLLGLSRDTLRYRLEKYGIQ